MSTSHNKSFVLQGIEKTVYEERPIPERNGFDIPIDGRQSIAANAKPLFYLSVAADEVLVEVKKTGMYMLLVLHPPMLPLPMLAWFYRQASADPTCTTSHMVESAISWSRRPWCVCRRLAADNVLLTFRAIRFWATNQRGSYIKVTQ